MEADDLRFEIRAWLTTRPTAAYQNAEILHGMRRKGHEVTADEIKAALTYLVGLNPPQVHRATTDLSQRPSWQITTAGIQAHESLG